MRFAVSQQRVGRITRCAMLTANDLVAEIKKYECRDALTPQECVQLAAFYTLLNTPEIEQTWASPIEHTQYSFTYNGTPMQSEGSASDTVTVDGNSEFFQAISGRKSADMWAVMGELMDALQAINPRLYNSVLRKINS